MGKKIYYRYNQLTESYERVYPSHKDKLWSIVKNIIRSCSLLAVILVILYFSLDIPYESKLKAENKQLRQQVEQMSRRVDGAIAVMDAIVDRDNNFYRVMLQAEPISDAERYAGLDVMIANAGGIGSDRSSSIEKTNEKILMLERQLYSQINSFDSLRSIAAQHKDRLLHMPSIQPISSEYMKTMASGYGPRIDPVYGTGKFHEGMDFSADTGIPVYATADGEVVDAGWNPGGYGNKIDISHGYGYLTRYAHLSKIMVVPGQEIKRGDLIGLVGNTGKSTGPHLHYEVRYKGQAQNPVNYYFQDLTPEEYARMVSESQRASHVMD